MAWRMVLGKKPGVDLAFTDNAISCTYCILIAIQGFRSYRLILGHAHHKGLLGFASYFLHR